MYNPKTRYYATVSDGIHEFSFFSLPTTTYSEKFAQNHHKKTRKCVIFKVKTRQNLQICEYTLVYRMETIYNRYIINKHINTRKYARLTCTVVFFPPYITPESLKFDTWVTKKQRKTRKILVF